MSLEHALFPAALAIVAALYASVGQAGGTGYIAVMALAGFGPDVIKPTALALNILVATIGTFRFAKAGLLTWRTCYPFAVLGAPFSVVGGATHLPASLYQPTVGALLIVAAVQVLTSAPSVDRVTRDPPFLPALVAGAGLGFVSGVTGVGGGIFLAPLVLVLGWVEIREAAAVSATFNLLNSAAALAGAWAMRHSIPASLPFWLLAVAMGGYLGSWLAVQRLPNKAMPPPIALLIAIAAVSPLGINMYLPSMPGMARALGVDFTTIKLTLSLYLAAMALGQLIIGPLSDQFGRRPVLLIGLIVFVIGSVICFAAQSVGLIFGRVVQAIGGCAGITLSRAIVRDLYQRNQVASMIGYVTMGMAVAPMIAPKRSAACWRHFSDGVPPSHS
jgi:uncharacterized membrane protein YfcA